MRLDEFYLIKLAAKSMPGIS